MLLVIAPLVLIGPLGGATLLAHAHGGHGSHWHAAPSREAAVRIADRHVRAHRSGHLSEGCPDHRHQTPCDHDEPADPAEPSSDPGLVTLPDHEPMVTHAMDLSSLIVLTPAVLIIDWALVAAPEVTLEEGSPGGDPQAPRHLCALRAVERIVATSGALLI